MPIFLTSISFSVWMGKHSSYTVGTSDLCLSEEFEHMKAWIQMQLICPLTVTNCTVLKLISLGGGGQYFSFFIAFWSHSIIRMDMLAILWVLFPCILSQIFYLKLKSALDISSDLVTTWIWSCVLLSVLDDSSYTWWDVGLVGRKREADYTMHYCS